MIPKVKRRTSATRASATYTPGELAVILNISRNGVYSALRDGTIPHVRIGRRFVIPRAAVQSWLGSVGHQRLISAGSH